MSDSNTHPNPNETVNRLAADLAGALHQIASLKAHAAQLSDELADANQQLQTLHAEKEQALAVDAQIAEKMRHGLSRDQAIHVIKRQRDYALQFPTPIRNPATA